MTKKKSQNKISDLTQWSKLMKSKHTLLTITMMRKKKAIISMMIMIATATMMTDRRMLRIPVTVKIKGRGSLPMKPTVIPQ